MQAFQSSVLTRLGAGAVRRYYEWQLLGPHDVVAMGAFAGDCLVAFCVAGVFRGAMAGFVARNRTYLMCQVLLHPHILFDAVSRSKVRGAVTRQIGVAPRKWQQSVPNDGKTQVFGVLSIGTRSDWQGRGAGALLMQAVEDAARGRGFESIELTVDPANAGAIRFYRRLDWIPQANGERWEGHMCKTLQVPRA